MTNSRDKGKRAEYDVRDKLRELTGLQWERVPGSGMFGAQHALKGDIYLPPSQGKRSRYCIEVKHYADDQITSNLVNATESTLEKWWAQAVREGQEMNMEPLLIFKKDRGKWLVGTLEAIPEVKSLALTTKAHGTFHIYLFDEWSKTADLIV